MKKILLILLCLPMVGFGQEWTYYLGGNDFDGKYREAYVIGKGDDSPYNKPHLYLNNFYQEGSINFYLWNSGYYKRETGTVVLLSFGEGKVYVCNDLGFSKNGSSVFINGCYDRKTLDNYSRLEILEKFINSSYVNIRIENEHGKNTMKFSLKGSSKAIKYVLPDFNKLLLQKRGL